ncbi:hypothetical protein Lser_V15G27693 [Lactuca serriola]
MSSRASFSDDSRMIKKAPPKSLLLRDYLLDDMSSCSSNGFRSYPRRQCCTTVRFLVEMDLNNNGKLPLEQQRRSIPEIKTKWKSKSKPKQKQLSVLQRASAAMIKAFKHFQFSGAGNPTMANFLPRSFSRKLLKHGLWKKTDHPNKEIKRLKSFGDFMKEKETTTHPPSLSQFSTAITTAELNSSTSNYSNSWSDSDFTTTTGNSSEVNLAQRNVIDASPEIKNSKNGKIVGATTATATTADTATNYSPTSDDAKFVGDDNQYKKWQNQQDEQFSPASVMDFPSNNDNDVDDEEEVSSMFQHTHIDVEGTKKIMYKTRRFEGVLQLEPIKLEDRITQFDIESSIKTLYEVDQEENHQEKKALALLQLMKSTISSLDLFKYEVMECLLLEFFKEKMIEQSVSNYEILKKTKDWMDGQVQEILFDWESKKSTETCIREMEKGVNWSKYDNEVEKENVGMELEYDIFNSLVDDILLDFHL